MSVKNLPIALTDVTAAQYLPLGSEYEEDLGDGKGPRVYTYVQNGDSGAWSAGDAIARKDGATTKVGVLAPLDTNPARVMGFVQQTSFPQNYYGFVQKRGDALVKSDSATGVTANTPIVIGTGATAGRVESDGSVTAFEAAVGWGHTAIASGGATGRAYVNCAG